MDKKRKQLPPCLGFEQDKIEEPEQTKHNCSTCHGLVDQGKPLCEEDCEPDSEKCLSHECRR